MKEEQNKILPISKTAVEILRDCITEVNGNIEDEEWNNMISESDKKEFSVIIKAMEEYASQFKSSLQPTVEEEKEEDEIEPMFKKVYAGIPMLLNPLYRKLKELTEVNQKERVSNQIAQQVAQETKQILQDNSDQSKRIKELEEALRANDRFILEKWNGYDELPGPPNDGREFNPLTTLLELNERLLKS